MSSINPRPILDAAQELLIMVKVMYDKNEEAYYDEVKALNVKIEDLLEQLERAKNNTLLRPASQDLLNQAIHGWMGQEPGRKINAIKFVREITGMGLKEAKDYVEAHHPSGPQGNSMFSPKPPQSGASDYFNNLRPTDDD